MSTDTVKKSCWTCTFQDIYSQGTFLGRCKYFATQGKETKDIPPSVVDVGCKFWKERPVRKHDDEPDTET